MQDRKKGGKGDWEKGGKKEGGKDTGLRETINQSDMRWISMMMQETQQEIRPIMTKVQLPKGKWV